MTENADAIEQDNRGNKDELSQFEKDLLNITHPKGYGEDGLKTDDENYYLREDCKIYSPEIIQSYGKRVEELCKNDNNRRTYTELGKICGISGQAIKNIVLGKQKSVNIVICNKLAKYFGCSAYYILGVVKNKDGILVDGKEFRLPLCKNSDQETINVTMAGRWAKIDPDLFSCLDDVFHLNKEERQAIKKVLSMITRH